LHFIPLSSRLFLLGLIDNIFVLPYVKDLLDYVTNHDLLGHEPHHDRPYQHEECLQTTNISQELQNICRAATILVIELICPDVHCYKRSIFFIKVIVISVDVDDLMKLFILFINVSNLEQGICKLCFLLLNKEVRLLMKLWNYFEK